MLIVHKSDVDGQTGMLRLRVQVESPHHLTGELTRGPMESVAIYPQALANLLGTDQSQAGITTTLRQWLAPRHREMLVRKRMIEAVSTAVADLNGGVKVDFGEDA